MEVAQPAPLLSRGSRGFTLHKAQPRTQQEADSRLYQNRLVPQRPCRQGANTKLTHPPQVRAHTAALGICCSRFAFFVIPSLLLADVYLMNNKEKCGVWDPHSRFSSDPPPPQIDAFGYSTENRGHGDKQNTLTYPGMLLLCGAWCFKKTGFFP